MESPHRLSDGIDLLRRAYHHARELGEEIWQFAVLVSTLEAVGLRRSELQWLVSRGYLDHAVESTRAGAGRRQFQAAPLAFGRRRCFVLTDAGIAFLRNAFDIDAAEMIHRSHLGDAGPKLVRPRWDRRQRKLWVGQSVVKWFRRAAPNQERVLAAFEEQGWPERIDDPLPGDADLLAQERLHDTIKSLNRGVTPPLIRFRGDGTGQGVIWESHPDESRGILLVSDDLPHSSLASG